jgi:hypothetical protein
MEFYRVYHITSKGETASLTNFMALNDVLACEHAIAIMAKSKWPGAEVWKGGRRVHCAGVAPLAMGPPERGDIASPFKPPPTQLTHYFCRMLGIR